MALLKTIFMLMIMMGVCGVLSTAVVYEGGDSAGWTSLGSVDYRNWAAGNNFHGGDTLVFNYNNQFHVVKQVSVQAFISCNATSPFATYTNGSDLVTLEKVGHFYFISGYPDHCQSGQKVNILVTPSSPSVSPPGLSSLMWPASFSNFATKIYLAFIVLPQCHGFLSEALLIG